MSGIGSLSGSRSLPLLLGLTLILSLAASGMYLLWPQYKHWKSATEQHRLLQRSTRNQGDLAAQLDEAKRNIEALNRQLYGELTGLPERQIESYLVGRLQKISWDSGVELVRVVPTRGERIQDFRENLFEVRLQARYRDFFDWLTRVKQDLGYSVIQRFQMQPAPNQNQAGQRADPLLDITLTLVIYRMEDA